MTEHGFSRELACPMLEMSGEEARTPSHLVSLKTNAHASVRVIGVVSVSQVSSLATLIRVRDPNGLYKSLGAMIVQG